MKFYLCFSLVLLFRVATVWGQVNPLDNNVARDLWECYNNTAIPGITIANNRPPATMNILIEYIRKLEDANPTMSPTQLSNQIIQRLRQDGISRREIPVDERYGIPFASTRLERYRFRVLVRDLLPNVQLDLSSGELSNIEKCSLHYMISNTIDELRRENEAKDCPGSARYTSRISRRDIGTHEDLENTELLSPDAVMGVLSANLAGNVSQCPIELGVVYSPFGTIKAGDFLAGIATGLNYENYPSNNNNNIDNRYAGTIVGELCEASLYQATVNVDLGAAGGWNSTINPKYFLLQSNKNLEATDAELRGGLDGLYMGLNMKSWTSKFSDLKISQILDMYYSPYEKGVFDNSIKACNRNILYTEMTPTDTMRNQLTNFMPILNKNALSGASLSNDSFPVLSAAGVQAFGIYLPTLKDLACTGVQTIERVASNLLIIIDSRWDYWTIQSVLSYVLNNIDVNKFATRYTLYGGMSLRNLTNNETRSLSEFYIKYNQTVHNNETNGFDYINIFQMVESFGRSKLNNQTYTGGESTIVLFVPKATLTDEERKFVSQRKDIINRSFPDMRFLVLGIGNQADYETIVANTNRDVVILQETTSEETLKNLGQQLVNAIKEVPRAIVNPSCTSQFNGGASTFSLTDYVELQGTNYYRISPNYFATGSDSRNLRIREQGYGTISVCISRDNSKPDNTSSTCRSLSNNDYNIEITSYCDGSSAASCLPIYLSVSGTNTNIKCKDALCRFPNDIKYIISMENVGCASSSISILQSSSIILVFSTYLFLKLS